MSKVVILINSIKKNSILNSVAQSVGWSNGYNANNSWCGTTAALLRVINYSNVFTIICKIMYLFEETD